MATQAQNAMTPWRGMVTRHAPVIIGLLLLVIPSLINLIEQSWSTEAGVHGPIVLATGIWLIWRRREEMAGVAQPGSTGLMLALMIVALPAYAFARAFDFLSVEIAALDLILIAACYGYFGAEVTRRLWFPIVYLSFLIPLPLWFIDSITAPLKTFVSWSSSELLASAGYPIIRQGVTLHIAQYQLLVEDACAGLNSLISLTVISLFYIYLLHNASWRYSLLLMLWILPLALLANMVRIILLVLLTYHVSNEAAQGFLHSTAGLMMFTVALLGIFAVDAMMQAVGRRMGWIRP